MTLFYIFPNSGNVWLITVGLVSASARNLFQYLGPQNLRKVLQYAGEPAGNGKGK